MGHSKQATPDAVWAAEYLANLKAAQQVEPVTHICGNCRTPTGRSALRCKNETGGR